MKKTKLKLERFDFNKFKGSIHLLPTVVIIKDDYMYREKNLAICVHFLWWHWRWLWLEVA